MTGSVRRFGTVSFNTGTKAKEIKRLLYRCFGTVSFNTGTKVH